MNDTLTRKNNNCLNLFRLLAALDVFYNHAVAHFSLVKYPILELFQKIIPGVPTFFFLSGMLIWFSIERTADFRSYVSKRILRIYPELWIAVIVELMSIIIFYKSTIDYPKLFMFGVAQGTLLQFWTPAFLRGYGVGTPNGSLWTICVIVQFYILAWGGYKLLHKKSITKWLITITFSISMALGRDWLKMLLPELIYKLFNQTIIPYLWMFVIGAFCSEFFETIINYMKKYWSICLTLLILYGIFVKNTFTIAGFDPNVFLLFSCVCLGVGYSYPQANIRMDISYGIYIYHMIVINAMVTLNYLGSYKFFVISLVLTVIFAYLSTVTVGKLSANRKRKIIFAE